MTESALIPSALAIRENRAAAKSANTRRALLSHWQQWEAWCALHDLSALPAHVPALEAYMVHLANAEGLKPSTISARLWAIDTAHTLAGIDAPGRAEPIRLTLAGIKRRKGRPKRQARPLVLEDLAPLPSATLSDKRNRALLLMMWAGALRRSEAVAIDVEHISPAAHGLDLLIPHSKTDQTGQGATVAILSAQTAGPCPVLAVQEWLTAAHISEGPVFRGLHKGKPSGRLHDASVNRIIKRACTLLGLDPDAYSGHSLRSGAATFWAARGKPISTIARHGRWKSADMVLTYARGNTAHELSGEY